MQILKKLWELRLIYPARLSLDFPYGYFAFSEEVVKALENCEDQFTPQMVKVIIDTLKYFLPLQKGGEPDKKFLNDTNRPIVEEIIKRLENRNIISVIDKAKNQILILQSKEFRHYLYILLKDEIFWLRYFNDQKILSEKESLQKYKPVRRLAKDEKTSLIETISICLDIREEKIKNEKDVRRILERIFHNIKEKNLKLESDELDIMILALNIRLRNSQILAKTRKEKLINVIKSLAKEIIPIIGEQVADKIIDNIL